MCRHLFLDNGCKIKNDGFLTWKHSRHLDKNTNSLKNPYKKPKIKNLSKFKNSFYTI